MDTSPGGFIIEEAENDHPQLHYDYSRSGPGIDQPINLTTKRARESVFYSQDSDLGIGKCQNVVANNISDDFEKEADLLCSEITDMASDNNLNESCVKFEDEYTSSIRQNMDDNISNNFEEEDKTAFSYDETNVIGSNINSSESCAKTEEELDSSFTSSHEGSNTLQKLADVCSERLHSSPHLQYDSDTTIEDQIEEMESNCDVSLESNDFRLNISQSSSKLRINDDGRTSVMDNCDDHSRLIPDSSHFRDQNKLDDEDKTTSLTDLNTPGCSNANFEKCVDSDRETEITSSQRGFRGFSVEEKPKKNAVNSAEDILYVSDSESKTTDDIDYSNLKPDEIRALVENAKRKARKEAIADLYNCPLKRRKISDGSEESSFGSKEPIMSRSEYKAFIGKSKTDRMNFKRSLLLNRRFAEKDPVVVDLSDSEETPRSSSASVAPKQSSAADCIVISSDEDEGDIVCEEVVKLNRRKKDSVIAGTSTSNGVTLPPTLLAPPLEILANSFDNSPGLVPPTPPVQQVLQVETFDPNSATSVLDLPEPDVNLESWLNTINFMADLRGMPSTSQSTENVPSTEKVVAEEKPAPGEVWSCPICLEPRSAVEEIVSTSCGHVFCGTCLRSSIKIHRQCPTCRKRLTARSFHKIFL